MNRFPRTINKKRRNESTLDESRILVGFKEATKIKEVLIIARELNLKVETSEKAETDDRQKNTKRWIQINHTDQRFWLRTRDGSPIDENEFIAIKKGLGKKAAWIAPVYRSPNDLQSKSRFSPMPMVLLIKKGRQDNTEAIIKEFGLKIDEAKSKYLTAYYYVEVADLKKENAYELQEKLLSHVEEVLFENMPMYKPLAATIPNDTLWANQWDMMQINAPNGWDISSGSNAVVVCVLDEGCDLTHPDLQFSEQGINLGTMMPTGAPTGDHGTACAGIAAGTFNNNSGVAGVAGNCLIMPLAFQNWTDVEVANGINYATTNGAEVISMSFGWDPWDPLVIDPEILNAFTNDVVMCVATHNYNSAITYPATNPLVIACGASSTDDNRKSPTSPDGENWGSDFGDIVYIGVQTGVSVVAPGVLCPTTDRQGGDGYGNDDYINDFNGTSAATPHVAGLAALLKSQYPTLTTVLIRNIIERSAAKVGTLAYAENTGFPNGTRNQEMGYGRIDVFNALDYSDTMIKDWSGDGGIEPSTPPSGNFWDFSDIVTRITDDNVFNPSNPSQSKHVEKGQTNYIYVQVTNNGPRDARNVAVNIRITPYIGLQFVYPNDWTAVDATHVNPTSVINNFSSVPAGTSVIAKFTISVTQVEDLYGWQTNNPWHPCLLAEVTTDNDYAYASSDLSFGNIVVRKNNFAQRNLTVIDVLASPGASIARAFPFVVGNRFSNARSIRLNIDKSRLPENAKVMLKLTNNNKMFPEVDFTSREDAKKDGIIFREKAKIVTRIGCCDVLLTLEKNSKLEVLCGEKSKLNVKNVKGGELIAEEDERLVRLSKNRSVIEFESQENNIYALSLQIEFPNNIKKDESYALTVFQTNERNEPIGGASVIYNIK